MHCSYNENSFAKTSVCLRITIFGIKVTHRSFVLTHTHIHYYMNIMNYYDRKLFIAIFLYCTNVLNIYNMRERVCAFFHRGTYTVYLAKMIARIYTLRAIYYNFSVYTYKYISIHIHSRSLSFSPSFTRITYAIGKLNEKNGKEKKNVCDCYPLKICQPNKPTDRSTERFVGRKI